MKNKFYFTDQEAKVLLDKGLAPKNFKQGEDTGRIEGYANQCIVIIAKTGDTRFRVEVMHDDNRADGRFMPRTDFARSFEVPSIARFKKLVGKVVRYTKMSNDIYFHAKLMGV